MPARAPTGPIVPSTFVPRATMEAEAGSIHDDAGNPERVTGLIAICRRFGGASPGHETPAEPNIQGQTRAET